MEILRNIDVAKLTELLMRPAQDIEKLREPVSEIINAVRRDGDAALRSCTLRFDGVSLAQLRVSEAEIAAATPLVSDKLKEAMALAAKNIEVFHRAQQQQEVRVETMPGVACWRKSVGIERVGLYVPGGSAPLFSTVLMLGIPARIAGCRRIALCTPPNKNGGVHPAILYAAQLVGVQEIYRVGGSQAIAALALGTESMPRVDKIFGPGNAYVTVAKQLVSQMGVAIDMPAGPSEVMVLADNSTNPDFAAADLLSQAEHGADSQVVLVSDSETAIENILAALKNQLQTLPRRAMAEQSLAHSKALLVHDHSAMMRVANEYAPEHLIVATRNAEQLAELVVNAGSVFVGSYSCESAGDYASGTNHALPTAGYARAFGGVSLDSFVKKITFQHLTREGASHLAPTVMAMAEAEGLEAHRRAMELRNSIKN